MNTSSTNKKSLLQALEEIQHEITEAEELDFEKLNFEDDDYSDDDYYHEPSEAEEWYDFDPDCQGGLLKIKVRNNNVNTALRMLKRKTKEDLALLKEREYFEKPSESRNKAKQAAKLREKRRQKGQSNDKNKQF